jgi:hypothetical protein
MGANVSKLITEINIYILQVTPIIIFLVGGDNLRNIRKESLH